MTYEEIISSAEALAQNPGTRIELKNVPIQKVPDTYKRFDSDPTDLAPDMYREWSWGEGLQTQSSFILIHTLPF